MTDVSTIIKDAYRESSLIAIGAEPTGAEAEEGLRFFNRYLASVYGTEASERFIPIIIGRNNISRPSGFPYYDGVPDGEWIVPPQAQLLLNLDAAQTVYLDPNPEDGQRFAFLDKSLNLATYNLTVIANGRTIEGATSLVANEDGQGAEYFYRSDLGEWKRVTPLEAEDDFPFPPEFEDLFVIGVSIRINPRHLTTLDEQSAVQYKRLLGMFKARYRQIIPVGSELGLILTGGNKRRWVDDTTLSNAAWNSGYDLFRIYR